MQLKKTLPMSLIKFEASWQAIGIQELRKTIIQGVIHFGYPKLHLASHVSQYIWQIRSGEIFSLNISDMLYTGNVKQRYRSTNKLNFMRQLLKHNDQSSGYNYMEMSHSHPGLRGWSPIDSAQVLNLLSTADKQWNTHRAHHILLQHCQDVPFDCPVSPQVHYWRAMSVHGLCRSIKLISLWDALKHFRVCKCRQLCCTHVQVDRRNEDSGLVLRYDQNVLKASIFNTHQSRRLSNHDSSHSTTSIDCLRLCCKVDYIDANQVILAEVYNIWVQYTVSDLDNTLQGQAPSSSALYFSCTPQNPILQCKEWLPAGKTILTFPKSWKMTQQWIMCPSA